MNIKLLWKSCLSFQKDCSSHRINKPAVQWKKGDKYWMTNNKYHRLDGPAVELSNGSKQWWVDGKVIKIENKDGVIHVSRSTSI